MKTMYSFFAAALLLIAVPFTGKANNNLTETTTISEKQVSVQYAGTNSNSVVFRVAFENSTAQPFTLIIKNEDGDILFQGKYTDAHFAKAIHLINDGNDITPTFIVRTEDQKFERSFKVSINNEEREQVIVSRL